MPFVKSGEAQIHYELEGPSGSPVLVFSNSLGANYSMWDPQIPAFLKSFRVLRYDTRGHGQSSTPPDHCSIRHLAKDVLALADDLNLDSFHFCGLSMGGQTGMWLALNSPHRMNKLVLCNTAARIGTHEFWNTRIEAVRTGGMKQVACAVVERWFTPAFREKNLSIIANTQRILERTNSEGYARCCGAVRDFDFRERLPRIQTTTLVISGTHDPATPPSEGHFLAEHIPGARYVELNAAHLSNIEDQHRFNKEVAEFLNA